MARREVRGAKPGAIAGSSVLVGSRSDPGSRHADRGHGFVSRHASAGNQCVVNGLGILGVYIIECGNLRPRLFKVVWPMLFCSFFLFFSFFLSFFFFLFFFLFLHINTPLTPEEYPTACALGNLCVPATISPLEMVAGTHTRRAPSFFFLFICSRKFGNSEIRKIMIGAANVTKRNGKKFDNIY